MYIRRIVLVLMVLLMVSLPVLGAEENIAAIFNGEEITVQEVDNFSALNQKVISISKIDKDLANILISTEAGLEVLNEYRRHQAKNLITGKLLVQEAKDRGIVITEQEKESIFNDHINKLKEQNDYSDEDLLKMLADQGFETLEAYNNFYFKKYSNNFLVQKLQMFVIDNQSFKVTDEEISKFYEDNKDKLKDGDRQRPLEEVKEAILKTLLTHKQNLYLQEFIDQVYQAAEVDVKI